MLNVGVVDVDLSTPEVAELRFRLFGSDAEGGRSRVLFDVSF